MKALLAPQSDFALCRLQYGTLLAVLDDVADRAISVALEAMGDVLTEPAVARIISQHLPPGALSLALDHRACPTIPTTALKYCLHLALLVPFLPRQILAGCVEIFDTKCRWSHNLGFGVSLWRAGIISPHCVYPERCRLIK